MVNPWLLCQSRLLYWSLLRESWPAMGWPRQSQPEGCGFRRCGFHRGGVLYGGTIGRGCRLGRGLVLEYQSRQSPSGLSSARHAGAGCTIRPRDGAQHPRNDSRAILTPILRRRADLLEGVGKTGGKPSPVTRRWGGRGGFYLVEICLRKWS